MAGEEFKIAPGVEKDHNWEPFDAFNASKFSPSLVPTYIVSFAAAGAQTDILPVTEILHFSVPSGFTAKTAPELPPRSTPTIIVPSESMAIPL